MPNGLIILNKPTCITSRDAVNVVQRLVRPLKVGHAGTLDPLATGVLVVCVGTATRLIEYVQRKRKEYVGTFLLGRTSDTEDIEGDVVQIDNPPIPSLADLQQAAKNLIGRTMQRPPAYSALNVAGRRAYDLARRGQEVQLERRQIDVYRCEISHYNYPEFVLEITCGGGTYVRSLGRDLAESMGTGAVMSALTRTAIGDFGLAMATAPDELTSSNWVERLLPPTAAVGDLPQIVLTGEQVTRIRHGQAVMIDTQNLLFDEAAAMGTAGELVAIVKPCDKGTIQTVKNF